VQPDTSINRYTGLADAAYWHNVNEGDYFYTGNVDNGNAIYAGEFVFKVSLGFGKKTKSGGVAISVFFIDGSLCSNSEEQPPVITNLGGQVKWGCC
jgi:hypothetical protein